MALFSILRVLVMTSLRNGSGSGSRKWQLPGPVRRLFFIHCIRSRAHRDEVNAKVMKDPFMNDPDQKDMPMPFDMKRLAYGGFNVIVEA